MQNSRWNGCYFLVHLGCQQKLHHVSFCLSSFAAPNWLLCQFVSQILIESILRRKVSKPPEIWVTFKCTLHYQMLVWVVYLFIWILSLLFRWSISEALDHSCPRSYFYRKEWRRRVFDCGQWWALGCNDQWGGRGGGTHCAQAASPVHTNGWKFLACCTSCSRASSGAGIPEEQFWQHFCYCCWPETQEKTTAEAVKGFKIQLICWLLQENLNWSGPISKLTGELDFSSCGSNCGGSTAQKLHRHWLLVYPNSDSPTMP